MELKTFIDRVLTENNMLQYSVEDVKRYVTDKAKKEAGNSCSIGIDDETIKKWILEYQPGKKAEKPKEETKKIQHHYVVPSRKRPKPERTQFPWGEQQKLF